MRDRRTVIDMIVKLLRTLQPNTLQKKTSLFILLPTFIILTGIGIMGLHLVRNALLEQWQQTAIAKLQRSAHHVDMRLMRPKELLRFLQHSTNSTARFQEFQLVIDQLRMQDGVVQVNHEWYGQEQDENASAKPTKSIIDDAPPHQDEQLVITAPVYNPELISETVSLIATFNDIHDKPVGKIEVVISFYDLVDQIVKAPWWKSNQAVLVDDSGNILTSTAARPGSANERELGVFGVRDQLEKETLAAMRKTAFGTVFDIGNPPDRVSGFYRLSEAPWTMVVISPGNRVLQPILQFRHYYFLTGGFGIIVALVYIRLVISTTTRSIKRISQAAKDLTNGRFHKSLTVETNDEVGELTKSFNVMVSQLEERHHLQEEMSIAREVQQNLLPHTNYSAEGLEIAGLSIYCQQTGGDYFDLLPSSEAGKATVIVGDVVGHGIGAALIMASVRSLLRCRVTLPGGAEEIIGDVNRLLCQDTSRSGNFATLFYLTIDRENHSIHWIRCGHDPAIVYNVSNNHFSELRGEGLVLGFDQNWQYEENTCTFSDINQVILIGSDGIWEAENDAGEQFGKDRVKAIIARYSSLPAEMIMQNISDQLQQFQNGHPQDDDITMTIIKTW